MKIQPKDQQLLQEAYRQTVFQDQLKMLSENVGGTVYVLYGDDTRAGVKIYGIFESEKAAKDAYNQWEGSEPWTDDQHFQIQPVKFGTFRSTPWLESGHLRKPGTRAPHPYVPPHHDDEDNKIDF